MKFSAAGILSAYLRLMQFDIHKALMQYKLSKTATEITGRWLDIGAGDQPYRKYFVNASEYVTTNTRRHYNEIDISKLDDITDFWIEDGKQLPVADGEFDGVACFQVLSVIENPEEFFKEMNRVLKPGGRLLLTTDFLYPVWSKEDAGRVSASRLASLCQHTGFELIRSESFGGFASMLYSLKMRYLRSYPEIWKHKSLSLKIVCGVFYVLALLLMPFLSLAGMLIYLAERRITDNQAFTFNLLLAAEKQKIS